MCGIWGVFDKQRSLAGDVLLNHIGKEMLSHRGPDGFGSYTDETVLLVHRRLSIIDLAGGSQPIYNEDKSKCIIFNGEIYNFKALKDILLKKGHLFKTNSDTEVIIHAYEQWGEGCVDHLRGMFAFAIWDAKDKKLFIARDRLGIKPLYYALVGDKFYFASEIKAILAHPGFPREMDQDGLAAYFSLSYIPAPLSIFKHIKKLPAGHCLSMTHENLQVRKYWDVHFQPDDSKTETACWNDFIDIFQEAVDLRMISDVPIGAFLSGGVDSGLVVALMSQLSKDPVQTFCMGFGGNVGGYLDERNLASLVSKRFGTHHREFEVQPNVEGILENLVGAFDEPFADDSVIPSYYLSKITRENVTVALSGLGGDEVFGGYERYLGFKLSNVYTLLPRFIRENVVRRFVEKIPERSDGHYTINHLKRFVRGASMPPDRRYYEFISTVNDGKNTSIFNNSNELANSFSHCQQMCLDLYNAANAEDPLDKVFYTDIKSYLPEDILALTDRVSMMHSLEVRVPFIDHKLMEYCATIPNSMKIKFKTKKYLLRRGASNYLPKRILNHRKQGFASPMTQWINNDLKKYIGEILSKENIEKSGVLNYQRVQEILTEHYNRVEIHDKLIWSMVIFQTWHKRYMQER